ncbi:PREDICTED: killer cell lectin-like receptor subfamily B member 1B allele A [Gekko japonicus]|uniref:Killer cell lectin-like receptor subfamily B member 1B allele A n=1 Tax=Gekko japonicus TaxID=146911 RepID=A0ABM1K9J7_GEKJA|nr:PREDICTED: killer cell lectin-like receptor subfamily B member 1B allele A [Gekko japonicus]
MAGEIVYADLKTPSEPHASSPLHPTRQLNAPQNPRWQQIMLWVACFGIVILVAVVIALVLQLEAEKRKIGVGSCPVKSNCSSDNVQSFLRSRFCNQSQGNSLVNSTCQICPPHWHHHQDKCYWLSKAFKSWNESQHDCSEKGAQLAVIQDKEEMPCVGMFAGLPSDAWDLLCLQLPTALCLSPMPVSIAPYLYGWFQEPPSSAGDENCGGIKNKKPKFDVCSAVYRWICQKHPILL